MADESQRIILKQLHIPIEQEPEKVLAAAESIRHFLSSLSANNFSRFEIVPPLGISYGPTDLIVNNQNREFEIKYEERELDTEKQRDIFYGSDLVSSLLTVSSWIDNAIRSKKLPIQLTQPNSDLQTFRDELSDLSQDEAKIITTYRPRLESVVGLLLKTLDQIFPSEVTEGQFANLQPLLSQIDLGPVNALQTWEQNILPLFNSFKETPTDPAQSFTKLSGPIPLLDTVSGQNPANKQVRQVFNAFTKQIQEQVTKISQTQINNLSSFVPQRSLNEIQNHLWTALIQRYETFYSTQDFVTNRNENQEAYQRYIYEPAAQEYEQRLPQYVLDTLFTKSEQQTLQQETPNFIFPEEAGPTYPDPENTFNQTDVQKSNLFQAFYIDSGLVSKLLGEATLTYPPIEALYGVSESEGGGPDEPSTPTQSQTQTLNFVVVETLRLATEKLYQQLNLSAYIDAQDFNYQAIGIDKTTIEELVKSELQAFIQQLPFDVEATIKNLQFDENNTTQNYYNPDTDEVTTNDSFKSWQKDYASQLVDAAVHTLSFDEENLLAQAVENIRNFQQAEGPIEERVTGPDTALVPDQISALLTKSGFTQPPTNNQFTSEWWQGLSAAEKRSAALAILGQHTSSTAELMRLQNVLLISYRATYPDLFGELTLEQLPPNLRALFADQVSQYLETLSFEDFQRIIANPGSARYFLLRQITAKLNSDPTFQAQLQSLLQTLRKAEPSKAPETQSAEETQQQIQKEISQQHLAEYLANPDSEEAVRELLKRYDEAAVQEFLTSEYGVGKTAKEKRYAVLTTTYGPEKSYKELKKLQDEEQEVYWKKRLAAEQFWLSLTHEEKSYLYQTYFADKELPTKRENRFWASLANREPRQLIDYSAVPQVFIFADVVSQLQQGTQDKSIKSTLNPFKRFKRRLSPAKRASDAIKSSVLERSAAFLSNLAVPGLGGVVSGLLALIPNKKARNAIAGGISAAIAGFIANTIRLFVSTAGGFIGGVVGGGIGAFLGTLSGTPFGIGGGTLSGWAIGTNAGAAILPDSILGFHGLTKGFSFGGTTSASTATLATQTGVSTTSTPYLATPTGAFIATTTAVTATAFAFNTIQQGAFLMPTIGDEGVGESQYVTIEKAAEPGIKMAMAQDITYTITIKANKGYSVVVNQMSDSMTISYNQEKNEKEPENRNHDATFFKDENGNPLSFPFTIEEGDSMTLQPYTESFNQTDHHDANVVNTFKLFFAVPEENVDEAPMSQNPNEEDGLPMSQIPDPNASPASVQMSEIRTATTGESVCFGECPQAQEGCWPVSGVLMQGPFCQPKAAGYSCTHSLVAAVDIATQLGAPVFSSMNGSATFYPQGTGYQCANSSFCYGNHVSIKTGNVEFLYAHMNDLYIVDGETQEKTIINGQTTLPVKAGDQIGEAGYSGLIFLGASYGVVGNTHLHWELRPSTLDMSQYVPGKSIRLGAVRSCYENQ